MKIKINAEMVLDNVTGDNVLECWIGDEYRTITISDAVNANEYCAIVDLAGYAKHGAALWEEIEKTLNHYRDLEESL